MRWKTPPSTERPLRQQGAPHADLTPFSLTPIRSRYALAMLLAVLALAMQAAWHVPPAGLLAAPLLLWPLWRAARQSGWLGAALPELAVTARGELILQHAGYAEAVSVAADSYVSPWLVVLQLDTLHGRQTLLLTVDSAPADALRRLRVYLRWRIAPHCGASAHP